jgi:Zn-dependent M28 family amino/carboxypeptidase
VLFLPCAALAVTASPAFAGPDAFNSKNLREQVTLEGVREHQQNLQFIADANNGTRASGTPGFDASADYVAARLEAAGYEVTRQEFIFPYFEDRSEFSQVAPTAKQYERAEDFDTMTFSAPGDATAEFTEVDPAGAGLGPGCEATDFAGFPAGEIALIRRGGCTFRIKADNAAAAGASAAVIYNNTTGRLNGTLGSPGVAIPTIGTTAAVGAELAPKAGTAQTLRVKVETIEEDRPTANIIADSRKGDEDRTVIAGAHLDSVLAGPGINDNGSGTGGILEIAEQMAKGPQPRNHMRFAFWGAEESGLLGSEHYVANLSEAEKDQILLNLNFDMIGSPNYVRFVYDGDNSAFPVGPGAAEGPDGSGQIESVFATYFENQGLASEPTPFSGRSDYGPFIAEGIPAGGLFTGAEGTKTPEQAAIYGGTAGIAYDPCYHDDCDTFENNSDAGLDEMSDAAAHAVYTYSRTKEDVTNGGRLKPGRNGTPTFSNDGTGTDSGGGLHADHDHEADAE